MSQSFIDYVPDLLSEIVQPACSFLYSIVSSKKHGSSNGPVANDIAALILYDHMLTWDGAVDALRCRGGPWISKVIFFSLRLCALATAITSIASIYAFRIPERVSTSFSIPSYVRIDRILFKHDGIARRVSDMRTDGQSRLLDICSQVCHYLHIPEGGMDDRKHNSMR